VRVAAWARSSSRNSPSALVQKPSGDSTPWLPSTPTSLASPTATLQVVQGTLTIWHSWNETQMPVMEEILQDFQAEYPEVLFDVLYIPQENLLTRFESAMLEGRETLESIAARVHAEGLEPQPKSGQQERLENLLNSYL
jgi:ABC-type glycerol-3-phosphate transport system substrate-binding protein